MRAAPSKRRAAAVLAAITVVLAAALTALSVRALELADREARLQEQFVAERLFDDMEGVLSAFLAAEEERPFDHWRPTVVVPGSGAVVASPLAGGPPQPYVQGYFQIDPDATVSSPHAPLPAFTGALSERFEGWGGEPIVGGTRSVDVVIEPVTWPAPVAVPVVAEPVVEVAPVPEALPDPVAIPEPVPVQVAPQLALVEVGQVMNQAAEPRLHRIEMRQFAVQAQVGNFIEPSVQLDARVPVQQVERPEPVEEGFPAPVGAPPAAATVAPAPIPAPAPAPAVPPVQVAAPAPRVVTVEVPAEVPSRVDVAVSPFRGEADADGWWLVRTVRVNRRTWVQGLVIDDNQLRVALADVVADLDGVAELSWTGGAFVHEFAEPFEGLSAGLTIRPLRSGPSPWSYIAGLIGLVALVAALGIGAAWRTTTSSLALAEERSDFVSAITHELRSPLTSIRMYAEMLQSGVVKDPAKQVEYFGVIRAEAERLSRLVEDVLTFARLERGGQAHSRTASLGEVCGHLDAVLGPVVARQGPVLVFEVAADAGEIPVASDAVTQVLTNLIDNAAKFGSGGVEVRVRATVGEGALQLSVRDHGAGVEQAVRAQMFEPFYRAERELTRETRGTGIGLSLVAGMIRELGGTVTARNHPEGGLEVRVRIPI